MNKNPNFMFSMETRRYQTKAPEVSSLTDVNIAYICSPSAASRCRCPKYQRLYSTFAFTQSKKSFSSRSSALSWQIPFMTLVGAA